MDNERNEPLNPANGLQQAGKLRVAIIDDDYWTLQGQRARLSGRLDVAVVAAVAHLEALGWATEWDTIDVAVIDAYDPNETFDRFPGVGVVESLRRRRRPDQTVAVVISGHMNNQLLKQRMFEAGADFYYHRSDIQNLDALIAAILLRPGDNRAIQADPHRFRELGIRPGARPNAAIDEVTRANMHGALSPIESQKATEASRRAFINLRERVAQHAKLTDDPTSAANAGTANTATWRTTKRFLNRALGRDLYSPNDD